MVIDWPSKEDMMLAIEKRKSDMAIAKIN